MRRQARHTSSLVKIGCRVFVARCRMADGKGVGRGETEKMRVGKRSSGQTYSSQADPPLCGIVLPRISGGSTMIRVPDELERRESGYAGAGKRCQVGKRMACLPQRANEEASLRFTAYIVADYFAHSLYVVLYGGVWVDCRMAHPVWDVNIVYCFFRNSCK